MMKISSLSKINHNDYYSKLIKEIYAGDNGETFMFLQFLYFSYTLSSFENEFTKTFYLISQDDIDHHAMLGECLVKLGGEPTYISSKNIALNGINFEYFKGLKQIIEYAIEIKEKSIINYKILLNKIQEKEINNILEMILCDEQKHKELLENMLKKYKNNQ